MTPVKVSPAPAVPRPALPVGLTNTRPSGEAIRGREPFKTRITSCANANSRAAATRSSSAALSFVPISRSISPGCGVSTTGRSGEPRKSAGHGARQFNPSASTTIGVWRCSTRALTRLRVRSSSEDSPGPMAITLARSARPRTCPSASSLTAPRSVSAKAAVISSGMTCAATKGWADTGVPTVTRPAPERMAALPQSAAAPVNPREPAITRT